MNTGVTDSSPLFALLSIPSNEAQSLAEWASQKLLEAATTPRRSGR